MGADTGGSAGSGGSSGNDNECIHRCGLCACCHRRNSDNRLVDGIRLFGLVCCRSSLYLSDGSHYSGGRNTDLDSRQALWFDIVTRIAGIPYITFASTIPFRLLFGIPTWVAILLWYRLIVAKEDALNQELEKELIMHQPVSLPEEPQIEQIDRITVKDGSKIHLIKTDELIYIQACGDYVMLITPSGEYLKEQTMKYFETHLPSDTFVRVHRSTIVNVTQISRVELFGKETYQLLLKNGVKLRVSLSGYRLLKERLGL